MSTASPTLHYTVVAPARLHLGFVDLNGDLGRQFASIGLAVEGLDTVVSASRAGSMSTAGIGASRVGELAHALRARAAPGAALATTITTRAPTHAGLGSGTQLALAAGTAWSAALDLGLTTREIALLAGRGKRSGIGIGAFEQGGFLLDGGRGDTTTTPPLLSRLPFPEDWRCVLIFDERHEGLSGVAERRAFVDLPRMGAETSGALARHVLVGVLPAVAEADFAAFSAHIGSVQAIVGDHFAPAQDGRFTSHAVGQLLTALAHEFKLPGIGQSSWGPTGFIFAPDAARAAAIEHACRPRLAEGLRSLTVRAANHGARLEAAG